MNISFSAGFSTGDLCQVQSDYDSDLATLDSGSLSRTSAFGAVFRELLPQTKDRQVDSDSDQKDEDSPQESRTHVVAVHSLRTTPASAPPTFSVEGGVDCHSSSENNANPAPTEIETQGEDRVSLPEVNAKAGKLSLVESEVALQALTPTFSVEGGVDCHSSSENNANSAPTKTETQGADRVSLPEMNAKAERLSVVEAEVALQTPTGSGGQELSRLPVPVALPVDFTPEPRLDPSKAGAPNPAPAPFGLVSILDMRPEANPAEESSILPAALTSKDAPDFSLPESAAMGDKLSPGDSEVVFTGRLVPQTMWEDTVPASKPQAPAREQITSNLAGHGEAQQTSDGPEAHSQDEGKRDLPARSAQPPIVLSTSSRDGSPGVVRQTTEVAQSAMAQKAETIDIPSDRESSGIVREISMRVGGQAQESAHVRVVERGGEVLVSVRTGSEQLARTLNSDLGELAHRLEQTGFQTELWRPVSETSSSESSHDRRGDPSSAGNENDGLSRDRRDSREHSGQRPQEWMDDLDESMTRS